MSKRPNRKLNGLVVWGIVLLLLPVVLGGLVGVLLSGATMYVETVISNSLLIIGYSYQLWGWASSLIGLLLLAAGIARARNDGKLAARTQAWSDK